MYKIEHLWLPDNDEDNPLTNDRTDDNERFDIVESENPPDEPGNSTCNDAFVSSFGNVRLSKIVHQGKALYSNALAKIIGIEKGDDEKSDGCHLYTIWVVRDGFIKPDLKHIERGEYKRTIFKALHMDIPHSSTKDIEMNFSEFYIKTNVIALPMLEDEDSMASALMIIGTSSTEGLKSGVSTDEGNESLGDG